MKLLSIIVLVLSVAFLKIAKAQQRWNQNFWALYCAEPAGDIDYEIGFDEPHENEQGKLVLRIRANRFSEVLQADGQFNEAKISAKIYKAIYGGKGAFTGTLDAQKIRAGFWNVSFKPAYYNKPAKKLICRKY